MFQKLCKIGLLAMICMSIFITQKVMSLETSLEHDNGASDENLQLEASYIVSNEDLYLAREGILANINGALLLVNSLKKTGNQWLVHYDHYDPRYQCPWGHSLCGYCHMCHKRTCSDYVPRCSASK